MYVTFRPDFSPALVGLVFELDPDYGGGIDVQAGKRYVDLRMRSKSGRWLRRTGYVDDLLTTEGVPLRDALPEEGESIK